MAYTIAAAVAAICVAFVFILVWLAADTGAAQGFWTVSDQFKESAKVDQIVFYVGESNGRGARDGYLIVAADGATQFNGPVRLKIARQWGGLGAFTPSCAYNLVMSHTGVMPRSMVMIIDRAAGSMTLKDTRKKMIYADLFRDNQMSAYALEVGEGGAAAAPGAESDTIAPVAGNGEAAGMLFEQRGAAQPRANSVVNYNDAAHTLLYRAPFFNFECRFHKNAAMLGEAEATISEAKAMLGEAIAPKIEHSIVSICYGRHNGRWPYLPPIADVPDGKIGAGGAQFDRQLIKVSDGGGWYIHDYGADETMAYQSRGTKLWCVFGRLMVVKNHSETARSFLLEDPHTGRRVCELPIWGRESVVDQTCAPALVWLDAAMACFACGPPPPRPGQCHILAGKFLAVTTQRGMTLYGRDFVRVTDIPGIVVSTENARIWIVRSMRGECNIYYDATRMRVLLRVPGAEIREWVAPNVAIEYDSSIGELIFRQFAAAGGISD